MQTNRLELLQLSPLSTISATLPKVKHGHQNVRQPVNYKPKWSKTENHADNVLARGGQSSSSSSSMIEHTTIIIIAAVTESCGPRNAMFGLNAYCCRSLGCHGFVCWWLEEMQNNYNREWENIVERCVWALDTCKSMSAGLGRFLVVQIGDEEISNRRMEGPLSLRLTFVRWIRVCLHEGKEVLLIFVLFLQSSLTLLKGHIRAWENSLVATLYSTSLP